VLDACAVEHALGKATRVGARLDLIVAALMARASVLAASGQSAEPSAVFRRASRTSSKEAKKIERRSKALTAQPALAASLTNGELSAGHIDAIAAAAARLSSGALDRFNARMGDMVEVGAMSAVDGFQRYVEGIADLARNDEGLERAEQQRRNTRLRKWQDHETGMFHLSGQFDPELGTRIFSAIDAATLGLKNRPEFSDIEADQRDAQALADLVLGAHRAGKPGAVEVVVLIDWETLLHGYHDRTVAELSNGARLPLASIRRLMCDASILPAALGGDGALLDLGRGMRHANREQRRALRTQYVTCAFPDCSVGFDHCEIHHVTPFEKQGPTDLANLLPLCSRHHHMVHEGNWRLALDKQRTITVWRPDGQIHDRQPHQPPYPPKPAARSREPAYAQTE
jgi:hypothetical protein